MVCLRDDEPVWKSKRFSRRQSTIACDSVDPTFGRPKTETVRCRPLCNRCNVPTVTTASRRLVKKDKLNAQRQAASLQIKPLGPFVCHETVQRDISHDVALNCSSTLDTIYILSHCIWMPPPPPTFVAIIIVFAFRMHRRATGMRSTRSEHSSETVHRTAMLSHQTQVAQMMCVAFSMD